MSKMHYGMFWSILPVLLSLYMWSAVTWLWACGCPSGGETALGVGKLVASALDHSHTRSTFQNAAVSPQRAVAVAHVVLAPPRGGSFVPLPGDRQPVPGAGGHTGSHFFVRSYVDGGILVELKWPPLPAGGAIARVGPLSPAGRTSSI